MKLNLKQLMVLVLALYVCLFFLPVNVSATEVSEDNIYSGTCGDDLTWTLSDGVLTISGSGDMTDWSSSSSASWYNYRSSITSATISDGVTSIGSYAFYNCANLTDITIPDSVISIGSSAFSICTSLTSAMLPDSVTSIGSHAFYSCTNLTSATLLNNVTSIGSYAFYSCTSLTSVTIPNSVTSIGNYAFHYCTSLTSITVNDENSVYSSLNGILFNKDQTELICCPGGKSGEYTVPDSVSSVKYGAFQGCISLTSVTIPDSVTSLGSSVFTGCTNLSSASIGNSVTSIGAYAFYGCTSLTSISIPDSVTYINDYAFQSCTSLTSVSMGNQVTYIGSYSFYYCTSLTSVTIPNSVTYIGSRAFYNCTNLASATIPDSVTTIGHYVFYNCTSLTSMTIPGSLTTTGQYAFYNCTSLTSVSIDSGVTTIGSYAFYNCTSLTSVTIPDSVTSMGEYAFYNCTSLTDVTIPNNVTSIEEYTFYNCTSLINASIGNAVTTIGSYAFYGCTSLISITIPNSVTSVSSYSFNKCENLTDVSIGSGATSVSISVFWYCKSLTSIIVNDENSVYSSLDGVLFNKDQTELICCPGGKTGRYTVPNSVTSISSHAFYYCESLTNVSIGSSTKSIGTSAFCSCTSLTSVFIPDTVSLIRDEAFFKCTSLTDVYYAGSERDWDDISIGSNNSYLNNATIHYNSTGSDENDGEEDDEEDDEDSETSSKSFYIKQTYAVIGAEGTTNLGGDFYFALADESDDLKTEIEAITWTSSNPDIATVEYDSYISSDALTNQSATGYLTITGKKPGLVTITGTTSDGRVASKQISVEPELQVGKLSSASVGTILTCSVELDEADAEYLEWFMENLTYSVTGTTMYFDQNCEVSEDGLSAVCSLEVTSIMLDYGLSGTSRIKFTSYGGQTATGDTMSVSNGSLNNEFPPATELESCVSDWNQAYQEYVDAVKSALQTFLSEASTSEEDRDTAIRKAKEAMMEWDEDDDNAYKYLTSNSDLSSDSDVSETMREAEYKALATYLYDNVIQAATDLELTTISAKDSSAAKLVSKLMSLLSGSSETYTYDNVTVRISGFSFYNQGYASITCTMYGNSSKTDTAFFCSDQNSCEEALAQYLEQLDGLYVSAIEQAAYECVNCACKVVLDKNLTSLTTEYLEKTLSTYTSQLKSIGVGDLINDLNSCYNYYNYIKKFTGLAEADESPENIYTAMSAITFKDSSIENTIVKKAYKALNKAATALNKAYLKEKYDSDDEDSDSVTDKLKAIFTCPVSVSVYSSDGTQIGYVGDDDIWYTEELIYIEESGDAKIIHSYTDDILSFTLTATGYGTLGCCIEEYDSDTGATIGRSNTYDVELTSGQVLEVASSTGEKDGSAASYAITTDNKTITADEYISAADDAVIYVGCDITGSGTVSGTGQYVRGDAAVLYAIPEEGYRFIGWYQDETIVSTDKLYEFTAKEGVTVSAVFVKYAEDISNGSLTLSDDSYAYDGSEKEPSVTVEYAGEVLTEKIDYVIYYSDNIEAGTATVTVIGIGSYTGILTTNFTIFVASGACGDDLTWTLDKDGLLSITGTGDMYNIYYTDGTHYDFDANYTIWLPYRSQITEISIGSGVTSIGTYAFYDCENITSINIPDTVESIGKYVFYKCENLESVEIGEGVTSIGHYAFRETGLKSIDIPDACTSIGAYSFEDCTSLASVTIPNSVTSIGTYAFSGCTSLPSIILPENLTSVQYGTFSGCSSLTEITIPDSVTTIYYAAFSGCTSLESAWIGSGVSSLCSRDAFEDCSSLTAVNVSEENESYCSVDGVVFTKDMEMIILFPRGRGGTYSIPEGVTTVASYAFWDCAQLTEVIIPEGVGSIGAAFNDCSNLVKVSVPSTANSFTRDNPAFSDCDGLVTAGPAGGGYNIEFAWEDTIPLWAFNSCESLESVTIPDNITTLSNNAFFGCVNVTSITIPDTVTSIGTYAIGYYYVSSKTTLIEDFIIYGYTGTEAETYATENGITFSAITSGSCGDAATWELDDDGVLIISGTGAMTDWDSFEDTPWDYYAASIVSVVVEEGVSTIGTYAFSGCTNLTSVSIPASAEEIGTGAFDGCTSLTDIYYNGTKSQWDEVSTNDSSIAAANVYYIIDNCTIGLSPTSYTYTGVENKPTVTVTDGDGNTLTEGADYTIKYSNNINAGTATVTVTGEGDYTGTATASFTISKASQTATASIASASILVGGTTQITASGIGTITYTSSNTSVATVDSSGKVTGKAAGTAVIKVKAAGNNNYNSRETSVAVTVSEETDNSSDSGSSDDSGTSGNNGNSNDSGTSSGSETNSDSGTSSESGTNTGSTGTSTPEVGSSVTDSSGNATYQVTTTGSNPTVTYTGTSSSGTSVTIPATVTVSGVTYQVTAIADSAFAGNTKITSVKIGSNVTSIGANAFKGCTKLASVTIGSSVTSVGKNAFYGCTALTTVEIPSSVKTIDAAAFAKCTALKTVTGCASVATVGEKAFYGDTKLTAISGMTKVTKIGSKAFYKCSKLATIGSTSGTVKLAKVKSLGSSAFYACKALKKISLTSTSLTKIAASTFYGCTSLTTFKVASGVKTIGSSAFAKCTALKTVTGCAAVTSVGAKAFYSDTKLMKVSGLQKTTSIGSKAFYKCSKLKQIGSSTNKITLVKVKTIGSSAFYKCTTLTYVNLTSTQLTAIDASAFQGCTALKTFVSKSTKLATIGKKAFYGDKKLASVTLKTSRLTSSKVGASAFKGIKSTCTFKVPSKKVSAYKKIFKAKGAGSKITVKKA